MSSAPSRSAQSARMSAIAVEYHDVFRLPRPPLALLRPVAAIARVTGRNPLAPELHGPAAPCAIADPGEDGLAALLARPVAAGTARGLRMSRTG